MGMNITKMPYNPGNYMAKRTGEKKIIVKVSVIV